MAVVSDIGPGAPSDAGSTLEVLADPAWVVGDDVGIDIDAAAVHLMAR
jgi:hypothetical protein